VKNAWFCLLLAVCASAGCRENWPFYCKPAVTPPPDPVVVQPVRQTPVVTADQVNKNNAQEKAQALREELDREAR
jgi:hypothetical protein